MLLFVVGLQAIFIKGVMPLNVNFEINPEVKVQIDLVRTDMYGNRSDPVTIFNNTKSNTSPLLGTPASADAVYNTEGNTVYINTWYEYFRNLSRSDTLTFITTNYTTNAEAGFIDPETTSAIKFEVEGITDQDGISVDYSTNPTNSVSYIKAYDGTPANAVQGTISFSINPLYPNTLSSINFNLELVEYENTIFSCDTYSIKEYTEDQYSKVMFAKFPTSNATYNTETQKIDGMNGYYYYLEMGEYPQTFVGETLDSALNHTFGTEEELNTFGKIEIKNSYGANVLNSAGTKMTLKYVKTVYQAVAQNNNTTTAPFPYTICPIYWFEDITTGETYARSLAYGYADASFAAARYLSTVSSTTNGNYDDGYIIPTTAGVYNWFKVEPLRWIIYMANNVSLSTYANNNAPQLTAITTAMANNQNLTVLAETDIDASPFNFAVTGSNSSQYGGNNWATSYIRSFLNGQTNTNYSLPGTINSFANPYFYNSSNLTNTKTYFNSNMSINQTTETLTSLLDICFNQTEQNSIATTTQTTYFTRDTFSGLSLNVAEGAATNNSPYYSLTQDKLFVLAGNNANESYYYGDFYNSNYYRRVFPTDYAQAHRAFNYPNNGIEYWHTAYNWLRSGYVSYAAHSYGVNSRGVVRDLAVYYTHYCLRPAFSFNF
ncbi:MAG: DUF6273 domain-containing protein [Clostridia bacterium]|nr:DUF6273 domain-containing protein [Clostridia bacterium]